MQLAVSSAQYLTRRALATDGALRLTAAASPDHALAALTSDRTPIRLLVTATALPGISGLELAEHLRTTDPTLRVVFITDPREAPIDPLAIFEQGDLLVKPFTPADLAGKAREAVEASKS